MINFRRSNKNNWACKRQITMRYLTDMYSHGIAHTTKRKDVNFFFNEHLWFLLNKHIIWFDGSSYLLRRFPKTKEKSEIPMIDQIQLLSQYLKICERFLFFLLGTLIFLWKRTQNLTFPRLAYGVVRQRTSVEAWDCNVDPTIDDPALSTLAIGDTSRIPWLNARISMFFYNYKW